MTQVPHFAYPFRFMANKHARVLEQDFVEEIANCCQVILKTPIGSRLELPEFGADDLTFTERGRMDEDRLVTALNRWEPRADATIVADVIGADPTRAEFNIEAHGREGE